MPDELNRALLAERGVIAFIGAGGKKSTMYALAANHPGRVAMTSTSHMYAYDEARVDEVLRVDLTVPAPRVDSRVVGFAGATDTKNRVGGLNEIQIESLRQSGHFELVLIKADGARARWIKAPAAYEPLVPDSADTVISVISIGVVGRALDAGIAHRPQRIAEVLGIASNASLQAPHIGRLLSSPEGGLRGVGQARVVGLINMVDDTARESLAREAAAIAFAETDRFDRIVLACMKRAHVVDVLEKP